MRECYLGVRMLSVQRSKLRQGDTRWHCQGPRRQNGIQTWHRLSPPCSALNRLKAGQGKGALAQAQRKPRGLGNNVPIPRVFWVKMLVSGVFSYGYMAAARARPGSPWPLLLEGTGPQEDANGFPAGRGSVRTWDPFISQVPAHRQDFLVSFSMEDRDAGVRAT